MFTIEDFLNLNLITSNRNLTTAPIPLDKPIECISINDQSMEGFIRKNELLLSVSAPYLKNEAYLISLIKYLIRSEASVLIFAHPGDVEISLTQKSIETAEEGGLPILQIPWDIRFADIFETIVKCLHEDYNSAVKTVETMQSEILKCFLDGKDLKSVTRIISKHLNCEVSIINSTGNSVTSTCAALFHFKTQIPLEAGSHRYGYLCLGSSQMQKGFDLLTYSLSPLLSLWFYRDEIIQTTQHMAKDDLIWSLANGSDPTSEEIMRSARLMDLHLTRSYVCIVGRVQLKSNSSYEWQNNWLDSNINTIRSKFSEIAKAMKKEVMITHHNNTIITYLEISSSGKHQVTKFLDQVEKSFQAVSRNLYFSWGISEINTEPTNYKDYYKHAKLAEELCSNDYRLTNRYYYENTLIYSMMSTLSSDTELVKLTLNILRPLLEYDKTKNTKLINTLRTYLSCKSISETARRLNRHRQTLLYQLEKVEDLTNMSLKNNDEVFLLEVCMRLHVDFNMDSP